MQFLHTGDMIGDMGICPHPEANGGVPALNQIAGPYSKLTFMPTGAAVEKTELFLLLSHEGDFVQGGMNTCIKIWWLSMHV